MSEAATPDSEYFLEIEGHFAIRRGTPFVLSAKDWALMKKWHAEGIPLPVVIEAIDQVFEKNESSGRRKVISSLSYCRHAVKELWEDRKALSVGDGESTPEEESGRLLEELAAEMERLSEGRPAVEQAAAEIRALADEKSVPGIEARLIEVERQLIDRLIASAEISSIRDDVQRTLGDTSRLDEKTRQRTEEANLRRLVREKFGLPRLTLFR